VQTLSHRVLVLAGAPAQQALGHSARPGCSGSAAGGRGPCRGRGGAAVPRGARRQRGGRRHAAPARRRASPGGLARKARAPGTCTPACPCLSAGNRRQEMKRPSRLKREEQRGHRPSAICGRGSSARRHHDVPGETGRRPAGSPGRCPARLDRQLVRRRSRRCAARARAGMECGAIPWPSGACCTWPINANRATRCSSHFRWQTTAPTLQRESQ
jgi:hypothetical protein